MSSNQPVRRILLIRLSHLGDVLHALPVFHGLRRAYPEARMAWAVQQEYAALVQGLPGLTRVLPFDRQGGWRAWRQLGRDLRNFNPDWTVDAQGNWKSAGVSFLSRAPRRSGLAKRDLREPTSAWVMNDSAPRWDDSQNKHAIDRNLHLGAFVCGQSPQELHAGLPDDWLQLSAVEQTSGRKRWRERMGESPHAPVIVQLSAPGDVRAWPLQHQRDLLRGLATRGQDVLVLSGPGEKEVGEHMAREFNGSADQIRHWVGQRGLRELAGVMRAAAEAGATLVSCDSGPMHLGALCGLKVIALAGPQDEWRTGPWPPQSPRHQTLRTGEHLECAPCLKRSCERNDGVRCMEQLKPQQVLEALGL